MIRPSRIRVEASSACQLGCPSCPTSEGIVAKSVGSGFLRTADLKRMVESRPRPRVTEIELSNYGEIFLNSEIEEILEYSAGKNIVLTASNGVNLNRVGERCLEALVRFRLLQMTVSIDGVTQDAYEKYRVGGDLEQVLNNIRTINRFKAVFGSPFPLMTWQFIIFGHNEHQIRAARKMAGELGMAFDLKLSWDSEFSPIRNRELVRAEVGFFSREEHLQRKGRDYLSVLCHQLWDNPQINWDGRVLGCCRNFWGDFGGNAIRDGLDQSLNNEKISYARSMLRGRSAPRDDVPCAQCEIYLGMSENSKWLRRDASIRLKEKAKSTFFVHFSPLIRRAIALRRFRRRVSS